MFFFSPPLIGAFGQQGLAHDENAALGEVLEAAAASTLREISYHPPLVGMLLRRYVWVQPTITRKMRLAGICARSLGRLWEIHARAVSQRQPGSIVARIEGFATADGKAKSPPEKTCQPVVLVPADNPRHQQTRVSMSQRGAKIAVFAAARCGYR